MKKFINYLLDEPCETVGGGEAEAACMGYLSYLEWMAAAAKSYIQS